MEETALYDQIKEYIESWAKNLDADQPTEEQKEGLRVFICNLSVSAENERPSKRARLANDDDENNDDRPDDSKPKTSEAKSLMKLAHHILQSFNDDQLQKLNFQIKINGTFHDFVSGSRVVFEEAVKNVQTDRVEKLNIGGVQFDEESVMKANDHVRALLCKTDNKLVEKINTAARSFLASDEQCLKWDESFVEALDSKELSYVAFPGDPCKGAALVVSGESGSGKTWFSLKHIPTKLGEKNLALIYYPVEDGDGQEVIIADDPYKKNAMACQLCMQYLESCDGMKYECVSKLSMIYNSGRDTRSYTWLKNRIEKILECDFEATQWWKSKGKTEINPVDKLVLVIDEVGKNTELARGLVSKVRDIYHDITNGKAKEVLLVLVGSGLDGYIRNDSFKDIGDAPSRTTGASFGTDPWKSNIIILKGPNLSQERIGDIPTKYILRGTYSRVLATNTRMLARGVVPIMKIPLLTELLSKDKLPERYEALGSINIVMDYAARKYASLNGLSRFSDESVERNTRILTQFKLLLRHALQSIEDRNPVATKMLKDLEMDDNDFPITLRLGLITSDVKSTSPALRYLACGGNTAPLYAQDGIGFEMVVQHHLVRLGELYNSFQNNTAKQDCTSQGVHVCNLRQAWPPASGSSDADLRSPNSACNRVQEMYKSCNAHLDDPDFAIPDGYYMDVSNIKDKVKDKDNFYLVMRQTVSNAQGPGIMVLRRKNGKVFLDLYQCKHLKTIPGVNSKQFMKSFWALGVTFDQGKGETINVHPNIGSAGYSYHGIKEFARKLGDRLEAAVEIGDRILVFSKGSEEWDCQNTEFLQQACAKGVMVWTREMMEPTISALTVNTPTT